MACLSPNCISKIKTMARAFMRCLLIKPTAVFLTKDSSLTLAQHKKKSRAVRLGTFVCIRMCLYKSVKQLQFYRHEYSWCKRAWCAPDHFARLWYAVSSGISRSWFYQWCYDQHRLRVLLYRFVPEGCGRWGLCHIYYIL